MTTQHIAIIDYKHPEDSYGLDLSQVDDCIVFDQQRMSESGYQTYGTQSGFAYFIGTSKTRSKSIGSIYILSNKFTDITLNGINDPGGFARLITSLSKQRKAVLKELEKSK